MLVGYSDVAGREFTHPEVCKDPDPLLLSEGQSEHNTHHCECSGMMGMCVTRLSKCATRMKLLTPDMATFDCLVIAPMNSQSLATDHQKKKTGEKLKLFSSHSCVGLNNTVSQ